MNVSKLFGDVSECIPILISSHENIPGPNPHVPWTPPNDSIGWRANPQEATSVQRIACSLPTSSRESQTRQEILADAVMTDFKNSASPKWNAGNLSISCWFQELSTWSWSVWSSQTIAAMARLPTQAWSAHWTLSWQWWQTPRHGKMAVWKVGMKLGVVMKCWIHVDTWIPMIASFWKGHDKLKASLIVGRACCSSGHFHLIVLISAHYLYSVCWEVTESVEVSPQVSPVLCN